MALLTSSVTSTAGPSALDALSSASAGAARTLRETLLTPARMAQGRAAVGVGMLAQPAALARLLGVDSAAARRTSWVGSMLGARELALGAGTVLALRRADRDGDPRPARLWVLAGLVSDAVDALVVARAVGAGVVRPGPGAALVGIATTATVAQVAALADDDGPLAR